MPLPSLVPFPAIELRDQILPEDWEASLKAWISLTYKYLDLPGLTFQNEIANSSSLEEFLVSFTTQNAHGLAKLPNSPHMKQLRRNSFLVTYRMWSGTGTIPNRLIDPLFIADFCILYSKTGCLPAFIDSLWDRANLSTNQEMLLSKSRLVKALESPNCQLKEMLGTRLLRMVAFLRSCTKYGKLLMTGSDFLDALISAWEQVPTNLRRKLTVILYHASLALLSNPKPNVSLLLDHMYSLKTNSERNEGSKIAPSILDSLVCTTPFLKRFSMGIPESEIGRAKKLLSFLELLKKASGVVNHAKTRPKVDKGKRAIPIDGGHLHDLSLIAQIQDLFPDLGAGFVLRLLEEYENDVEKITAQLLDNSLPAHLDALDRSLELSLHPTPQSLSEPLTTFSGHPERRNIHNNDALANLTISPSSIHVGKRDTAAGSTAPNKAAILAALATFDSDSDERDDTYDADDIGGTVDTSVPSLNEPSASDATSTPSEELLVKAWRSIPDVFQRDAKTRRSMAREELRKVTGLSDEAIEGWGIMLSRDPRRLRRLEASVSMSIGSQRELASTAWQAREDDGEDSRESRPSESRGRGGHRGRGRGGRGRDGGGVAGSASEAGTRAARQKRDANKGSRANHNRREQRAKKVARAGFPS